MSEPAKFVDRCHYSKTGWAIWQCDDAGRTYCTCKPCKPCKPRKAGGDGPMTLQERIQLAADRAMRDVLFGGTSAAPQEEPLTLEKLNDMMRQAEKMRLVARSKQVNFVVDAAHQGDMLQHTGPDGYTVECSPIQAREVHQHIPLRLVEVESEWRATFTPVSGPFDWATAAFTMPPWIDPPAVPESP